MFQLSIGSRPEFIYRTEVEVSGDENLDSIPILLAHRRRDVHGALEHLGDDVSGVARVVDHGATAIGRLRGRLYRAVDHRDQDRGPEAIHEVAVNDTREA